MAYVNMPNTFTYSPSITASLVSKYFSGTVLEQSFEKGQPFNLRTKSFDGKVLSSIDTDVWALDTISKIVTIMATSNQFILPTVNVNNY